MIRFSASRDEIQSEVIAVDPDWHARARRALARALKSGTFSAEWTRVKGVFIKVQHEKCGYCERRLPAVKHGKGEHDVEHFRPKGAVHPWAPKPKPGFTFRDGPSDGYPWLAYELTNYLASCRTCNSALKKNYFPIFAAPAATGTKGAQLATEEPLLLNPIDPNDDDPEAVLTFEGVFVRATARRGRKRHRAIATISMFQLNTREELLRERAERLYAIWLALLTGDNASSGPDQVAAAAAILDAYTKPSAPHAASSRRFIELHRDKPETTSALVTEIKRYLSASGPY